MADGNAQRQEHVMQNIPSNLISLDNAESSGADPRSVGVDSLEEAGHEKKPILRVIREKCMDCCCQQRAEVRRCAAKTCPLWPYRMGKNPFTRRKGNTANLTS